MLHTLSDLVIIKYILIGTVCDTTTPPATTTMTSTGGTTPCATFTSGGNANGAMCTFPFTYKSVAYYECTTIDRGQLWCATTSNYDIGGVYGYCQGKLYIRNVCLLLVHYDNTL